MIIIGVDEAGRGALVGNVVAGAVILPARFKLPGLTDSKKLSPLKREQLYAQITAQCRWAVGQASAAEIDQINILQATMLAMRRAVLALNVPDAQVLVDGNRCPDLSNCRAIIQGDLSEPAISAASIIAKVSRDRQMILLDKRYPQYGFAQHKGYGTRQHFAALQASGAIAEQHRLSFNLSIDRGEIAGT